MLSEGANGRIYPSERGVIKIQKRKSVGHDVITQRRIHHLAQTLIDELDLKILRVPRVFVDSHQTYEMEWVNTQKIIYPGADQFTTPILADLYENLCQELTRFWIALFRRGFAAWDYELFLQPDGTVVLLDFDKFGFRMTSGPDSILLPIGSRCRICHPPLASFFRNPCFPPDFVDRLRAMGMEPPADCLPTQKNED